jgi:hypothetical protein
MRLKKRLLFSFIAGLVLMGYSSAGASPPACHRNDISMYIHSDAVVEAVVKKSRRWSQGETVHLVAQYKVMDVFKGHVHKDKTSLSLIPV